MSAKPNKTKSGPVILANRAGVASEIAQWIGYRFAGKPFGFVCVSEWKGPLMQVFDYSGVLARVLVLFEGLPIDPTVVQEWRNWAMDRKARDVRLVIIQGKITEKAFQDAIFAHCKEWDQKVAMPETPAITRGAFVKMSENPTAKDDSTLLTMMFGSMGELLSRIEIAAGRFKSACNSVKYDQKKAASILAEISNKLEAKNPMDKVLQAPPTGLEKLIDHFPKVLLYGESGVGKTLIASYIQSRTGLAEGRPRRIPIPEYLGKEDAFEFDLLGYAQGAFTGGKADGDPGLLLSHLGGVIFLDEIGEANATIQAKLLAFLDDYRVRPRGWSGEPFHCPVLIVAATNRDLAAMVRDGSFRGDLLARFTDRLTVPPLRDRMEDIEFILDCLLQRQSLNPGGSVREIGVGALAEIRKQKFAMGNFRELEDWFRSVCERAAREGRHYLVAADVDPSTQGLGQGSSV